MSELTNKFAEILISAKKIYLEEMQKKLRDISFTFFLFVANKGENERFELKRFFHSLKGTAATLGFTELSKIGEKYENFIDGMEENDEITMGMILVIIEGMARVFRECSTIIDSFGSVDKVTEKSIAQQSEALDYLGEYNDYYNDGLEKNISQDAKDLVKEFNKIEVHDDLSIRDEDVNDKSKTDENAAEKKNDNAQVAKDDDNSVEKNDNAQLAQKDDNSVENNDNINGKYLEVVSNEVVVVGKEKIRGRHRKKKILLIDDENIIIQLISQGFSNSEFEIVYAMDGEDGVEKCFEIKPDLVLVDLMLPKISGFEVCRRIKNNDLTKDVKIIVLSSRKKEEDILQCFKIGVDDYMVKPFSLLELEMRFKRLCRTPET